MTDGPFLDHNLNRLHQGTARCTIGSLPVSYQEEDAPPSVTINANITAFVAPGLELKYTIDASYLALVHIPTTEDNAYFNKVLTINMICDDRQENYWALHRYMETIQRGNRGGVPIEDTDHRVYAFDRKYRNRLTWIPVIDIHMSDDSFQKHQTIRFERCYPLSLANLDLNFLDPSPVTFTAGFVYTNKTILRDSPPQEHTIPRGIATNHQ